MARINIETSEKYSMEIPEELYQLYLNGDIAAQDILDNDEISDEIWSCTEWADVDRVYVTE